VFATVGKFHTSQARIPLASSIVICGGGAHAVGMESALSSTCTAFIVVVGFTTPQHADAAATLRCNSRSLLFSLSLDSPHHQCSSFACFHRTSSIPQTSPSLASLKSALLLRFSFITPPLTQQLHAAAAAAAVISSPFAPSLRPLCGKNYLRMRLLSVASPGILTFTPGASILAAAAHVILKFQHPMQLLGCCSSS
jgi:hypothetical protein